MYVFLPAFALSLGYTLISGSKSDPGAAVQALIWIATAVGLFCWPMIIFVLIWGHARLLLHPIRMLGHIRFILGPYVAACAIFLLAALVLYNLRRYGDHLQQYILDPFNYFFQAIPAALLAVYVAVYAARTVGLLYRHYGAEIPWANHRQEP